MRSPLPTTRGGSAESFATRRRRHESTASAAAIAQGQLTGNSSIAFPVSRVPMHAGTERRSRRRVMRRTLLLSDLCGLLGAWTVAWAMFPRSSDVVGPVEEFGLLLLSLPLWILGATAAGLYGFDEDRADHTTADDLVPIFAVVTTGTFMLSQGAELLANANPGPGRIMLFWLSAIVFISVMRSLSRRAARRTVAYRQRTLIVGAGEVGQLLARKLTLHAEYGLDLVGFVDDHPRAAPSWLDDVPVLGGVSRLHAIVTEHNVDRVVLAFSKDPHHELPSLIRRLRDGGVQVDVVPRLFEVVGPKVDIHSIAGIALMGLPPVRLNRIDWALKRSMDIAVSGLALVVLAPLIALIALLVRRGSPGPVLFRQARLGKDMKQFTLLKFRTMHVDTDDSVHREYIKESMGNGNGVVLHGTGQFKLSREDAITRTGAWLRKTSLDELPQLWNVLRGDMSLVGPRPCLEYEIEHFADHHFERFLVPAGLTGLWQVSARAQSTFGEALDLDVLYAQSSSLGLDLQLLIRTPLQLLRTKATA